MSSSSNDTFSPCKIKVGGQIIKFKNHQSTWVITNTKLLTYIKKKKKPSNLSFSIESYLFCEVSIVNLFSLSAIAKFQRRKDGVDYML